VVLIVLESWRREALDGEVTPNLWKLAQEATVYTNHISAGAATVPGLFGLMYGTHATLYDRIKNLPVTYPSPLTEALAERGYVSRVFTGNKFDRFQLRTLFFSRVEDDDYHFAHDAELVEAYEASLATRSAGPRFDFIFFVSSHSPYFHPVEFTPFRPIPTLKGSFVFDKNTDPVPYLNEYHNSVYYVDFLIGRVIEALKTKGLYDEAWIVVTGDHAEEFNDNDLGFWGHGSNFSLAQTATPLIIKRPGQTTPARFSNLTLHQDIAPTLMEEALGCLTPAEVYADGTNLYRLSTASRPTVVSSYFDVAYINDNKVIEALRPRRYAWDDMRPLEKSSDDEIWFRNLMEAERRFSTGQRSRSEDPEWAPRNELVFPR
jgi:membrane-anchored protein YejM (alkaline phosphatase superfamily)